MAANSERRDSSSELLHELQSLSHSLFQSNTNHRPASLILDRSSILNDRPLPDRGSQSLRLSSPWHSHLNQQARNHGTLLVEATASREKRKKKGIWNWKPLRALSHVRMQRIACLFSVEVVSIHSLPAWTDGLRLSVSVRKKETREGAVRTMPSRVMDGSANFDETLYVKCHLFCNGKKPPVFEPRMFLISVVAVDAPELDFGMSTVDLSLLVKESIERSFKGERVKAWDTIFELSGKAKAGVLVLKLGFQIMEEKGVAMYSQAKGNDLYSESELKLEDQELSKLEIVDKGIEEAAASRAEDKAKSEATVESGVAVSREVVKEVIHQRILELESIAKEIKALEATMTRDRSDAMIVTEIDGVHQLGADEEMMTRKFLQMPELGDEEEPNMYNVKASSKIEATTEYGSNETRVYIPNLGKGLGPIIQTKDGGYLASMNPFNLKIEREETPKLAMQISKPFILQDQKQDSVFELFRKFAAMDKEQLTSKLSSLTSMDDLMSKTTGQIAFEGVASAIINGRSKEVASFSADRSISTVKMMAKTMLEGRKARTKKHPMTIEEMIAFSWKKIEAMAEEGLKIQAEMADEEVPSDVANEDVSGHLLDSAISLEEWARTGDSNENVKILVTIQLRDPIRQYEPVGGLLVVVLEAVRMENSSEGEQMRFTEIGIHVGGLKLKSVEGQKQSLSSRQWLVGNGIDKAGSNKKVMEAKKGKDILWSLSASLMENIWLMPIRNPNVHLGH